MWAPLSDDPPRQKQEILERSKHTPTPEEIAQSTPNIVGKAFYEKLPEILPSALIQQFTGALLVIHGSDDEVMPVSHGKRYYELMSERDALTALEIIDKGDHTLQHACLGASGHCQIGGVVPTDVGIDYSDVRLIRIASRATAASSKFGG